MRFSSALLGDTFIISGGYWLRRLRLWELCLAQQAKLIYDQVCPWMPMIFFQLCINTILMTDYIVCLCQSWVCLTNSWGSELSSLMVITSCVVQHISKGEFQTNCYITFFKWFSRHGVLRSILAYSFVNKVRSQRWQDSAINQLLNLTKALRDGSQFTKWQASLIWTHCRSKTFQLLAKCHW